MVAWRRAAVAGVLCAMLLAGPAPAAADVTISVEVAYGGIVVGGVGFFIYFAGSWRLPVAGQDPPTSLVEISEGRARLGIPVPRLPLGDAAAGAAAGGEAVEVDLLRWRF